MELGLTSSQLRSLLNDEALEGQYTAEPLPLSFSSQSFEELLRNDNTEVKPIIIENNFQVNVQDMNTMVKLDSQEGITYSQPILVKDEFEGDYNFKLMLPSSGCGKFWTFSEKLSKIFVKPKEVLPIFIGSDYHSGLYIRAALAYKSDQHRSVPVIRCLNHIAEDSATNKSVDAELIKHVVRCMHPKSSYHESSSGHLSVLAPLGNAAAGASMVPLDFKFYCQNSCVSGMNRRPTEIIFSLEDKEKQVLGRKRFDIRICSCPKRDMDKEIIPNIDLAETSSSKSKKRKLTSSHTDFPAKKVESEECNLNIRIIGKDNYNAVVKYIYDLTAGDAARTKNYDFYQPYLDETEKLYLSQ